MLYTLLFYISDVGKFLEFRCEKFPIFILLNIVRLQTLKLSVLDSKDVFIYSLYYDVSKLSFLLFY